MESQEKKYTGRGGWHGGGRPKKTEDEKTVYKTISVSGKVTEIEAIRNLAKEEGKTISRFLIELALEGK